jgi:hypothetical protein
MQCNRRKFLQLQSAEVLAIAIGKVFQVEDFRMEEELFGMA